MIIVYKHLRIRGYLQCIHCWAIEMTSETFHPLPWWPKSILDGSKLGVPASSNSSGSALPGMWLKDLRKEPDQSYNTAEVYRKKHMWKTLELMEGLSPQKVFLWKLCNGQSYPMLPIRQQKSTEKNTCERPWSWWKVWVLRKSSYENCAMAKVTQCYP